MKFTSQTFLAISLAAISTCFGTFALGAANDPFVGDWKLNPSKSKLIDRMKVESLGGNKYEFDFGGGPEKIVANGTDQPTIYGTALSVTVEGPDALKVVRKKDGRMMLSASWKLSQDGNTLTDNFTQFGADGSPSTENLLYKRTASGAGFTGAWEREAAIPTDSVFVLQIRPYEENGLSFIQSSVRITRNVNFDGKDYPNAGSQATEGATTSGRRVDQHTLELTDKIKGRITRSEQIELSPDRKTLTRTVHPVGQREPNIFVYERQ